MPDKDRRVQAGRISQKSAAYLKSMGQTNLGRAIDIIVERNIARERLAGG